MFVLMFFADAVSGGGISTEKGAWCDLNLVTDNGIHTITAGDCSQLVSKGNGMAHIYTDENVHKGRFAFGISVEEAGSPVTSWQADWSWEVLSFTDKNITIKGVADYQNIYWMQNWQCLSDTKGCKVTTKLTNNTGISLSNPKFMYFFDVDEENKKPIYYGSDWNKQMYNWDRDILITDRNKLNNKFSKDIQEQDFMFGFQDLIDNGYVYDMLYLGNLRNLDFLLPDTNGYVVAVTKGNIWSNGYTATLDPYLDVNAEGQDFRVGTNEFQMLFDQSRGGKIGELYDLINDPGANLVNTVVGTYDLWRFQDAATGDRRVDTKDATTRLRLDENMSARVKVRREGAFIDGGTYDINYNVLYSIYPSKRWCVHLQITDVNDWVTNYDRTYHFLYGNTNLSWKAYTDNGDQGPDSDDWWHQMIRTDLGNGDYNTSISYGYLKQGNFYNNNDGSGGKWDPTWVDLTPASSYWYDSDLDPDFQSGETDYLTYLVLFTDDSIAGVRNDEGYLDAFYKDFRNPDDLFMYAGTFEYFDFNTGAYLLTASSNLVDFNINTNVGGLIGDVNRYKPAFEIHNYTASTKPLVKYNGVQQVEDVNFVSDVNTDGDYAIVVWLHDIIADTDVNAHFEIADTFAPPADTCTPPVSGTWTIDNGDICTCKNEDIQINAGNVYIKDGSLSMNNCWIHLDHGYSIRVGDVNGLWRDFNSGFKWS